MQQGVYIAMLVLEYLPPNDRACSGIQSSYHIRLGCNQGTPTAVGILIEIREFHLPNELLSPVEQAYLVFIKCIADIETEN